MTRIERAAQMLSTIMRHPDNSPEAIAELISSGLCPIEEKYCKEWVAGYGCTTTMCENCWNKEVGEND